MQAIGTFGICCLFLTVCMVSAPAMGLPHGPEVTMISGLVIGHFGFVWHDPFHILFIRDPIFTHTLYPLPPDLSDDEKRKLDRVYYPRTRGGLTSDYDLIVLHDARIQHFTSRQVHDLDYAFREAEMTSIMVFMGSFLWDWVYEPTILRDVAPISRHTEAKYGGFSVVFRRERDPVFLPFLEYGIEKVMGNAIAEMDAKQGATIWADIMPQNEPWLVSWKPGGGNPGMQWALIQWYLEGWWSERNNPYALDVATNMILYSLEKPMIEDIVARREARRLFTNLQSQKSVALSMMEWADAFGANTLPLSGQLRDLEYDMQSVVAEYAKQDYAAAITFLDSVSGRVGAIAEEAVRLKDQALLWIYVIEWSGVTGTSLASGFLVWTLMVRRRFYREVGAVRLSKEGR